MDPILLVPSVLLAVALALLAWSVAQNRAARGRLEGLGRAVADADRAATEARVRLDDALARVATLTAERDRAVEAARVAETRAAVTAKEIESVRAQMADWEATKKQHMDAANAVLLKSGREAMNQLLETHKREAEDARKQQEERVRKTTENLVQQVDVVAKAVAAINEQVGHNRTAMDTVMRALSSPGGAGQFAEIGLENTLKSFGLERGRDFFIQQTVEGRRLRPDALLLLPGDTVWVIDSKASKHFLDLAEAEGTESEDEAYRALAATMNQHLRALADKDYRTAIRDAHRETGRGGEIRRIMSIMYVPNDGAVEKIARADPDFFAKARKAEITIVGPSMLAALIGFASIDIDLGKQAENQERIVQGTQQLLDGIAFMVDHTGKVGRGLKTAADAYGRLVGSINSRLLPRARGIVGMGVRPSRNKPLPRMVPGFHIVDDTPLIDGEAEEVEAIEAITDERNEDD